MRALLHLLVPPGARSRLSVLIFHRVRPAADPLFPNEPDAAAFETQLRWVDGWFDVLPLPDAVEGLRRGRLPARPLCITFDDGYADNAVVALPILRKLGLPATFFIATGYLNGGRMWNDTVIESIRRAPGLRLDLSDAKLGVLDVSSIEKRREALQHVIATVKHLPSAERQDRCDAIARAVGAALTYDLMLEDRQVRELKAAGMTIGAHTVTHPILATLPPGEAHAEIRESRQVLERLTGAPVDLFAYPNGVPGRDYGAEHVTMVRELGFKAAVSTATGVATAGSDLYQLPRFTPWDRTRLRFGLRLARNVGRPRLAMT